MPLSELSCQACGKNASALAQNELEALLPELPGWDVVFGHGSRWLEKQFQIKPYTSALDFVQRVGELAEENMHHPEIILAWGKVTVRWWTHTISDIHLNDCILAARCELLANQL